MPEIEICAAKPDDVEQMMAFEHGYYSEYVWQMGLDVDSYTSHVEFRRVRLPRKVFVPYPRQRSEIFNQIEEAEAFLIALISENPVGYIKVIAENDTNVARVTDLVVSAPMRRQGIASGLLIAVINLVSRRDLRYLVLELQSKNDPAIELANKMGFNFCGFRDHYFPNHELALFYSRFIR